MNRAASDLLITGLVLCSSGAATLAAVLWARWLDRSRYRYSLVYAALLLLIIAVAYGTANFKLPRPGLLQAAFALAVGLAAGYGARVGDKLVLRWCFRRESGRAPRDAVRMPSARPLRPQASSILLTDAILLAVLEEFVYRGFLLTSALSLRPGLLAFWAVIGSIAAFSLSHVNFGWPHVFAKSPLGVLAVLSACITGTLLAPVVAHLAFNGAIWREAQVR